MEKLKEPHLLRIFVNESDKTREGKSLHETLIEKALKEKMAGATAYRAFIGYGGSSHIHTTKILVLSENLPVIVEIIDEKKKIDEFLSHAQTLLSKGLITIQKLENAFHM